MSNVVLISTYELGRQPFGLASPAAWLREAGATVTLQDLAVSAFDPEPVRTACLVCVYVPMHTASRLAEPVLAKVREVNPRAHLSVYGLYAPMNEAHLRALGADTVIGGEFEQPLVDLYRDLAAGRDGAVVPAVSLARQEFLVPDRSGLPALQKYAHLQLAPGTIRTVGYTEATRGCKHLCRHCPVVPVYGGRFRVVGADVVLTDVRQQVAAGAQHITFGDPDFFNGPAHAMRVVHGLHEEFPELTYDVTIKIEHLRRQVDLLPALRETGCVLVTSAAEAVDHAILERFDKRHSTADLESVVISLREIGLAFNPTFVAFTPWTTLPGYADFLAEILRLGLVDNVSPVQYSIRLLIPSGSRLLELAEVRHLVAEFDPTALAYPWTSPDPRVDALQAEVSAIVRGATGRDRREIFGQVWRASAAAAGPDPADPDLSGLPPAAAVPQLSEPWYCCAEPTDEQFDLF